MWRWGRGRLYTYCCTVTSRMTSALRWEAMRAILMFHNCEGQSHQTVSTDYKSWRERRAEADSNRGPSAYQPNALPLGQTGSHCTSTYAIPPQARGGLATTAMVRLQADGQLGHVQRFTSSRCCVSEDASCGLWTHSCDTTMTLSLIHISEPTRRA